MPLINIHRRLVVGVVVGGVVLGAVAAGFIWFRSRPRRRAGSRPPPRTVNHHGPQSRQFEEAADWVRSQEQRELTQQEQLLLYGLYKQVTVGPCLLPQPSALDMVGRAKWEAWHGLGELSVDAARQQYLDLVSQLRGSADPASSASSRSPTTGMSGPVFSRPVMLETEAEVEVGQMPPLIEVISRQDATLAEVQSELNQVADLNSLTDASGWTPLHWACDVGRVDIAQLLLQAHANPNAADTKGETPLHIALLTEDPELVRLLCEQGANVHLKSAAGTSPLEAATAEYDELVSLLQEFA
jgi:acyl-CoA-binding protein